MKEFKVELGWTFTLQVAKNVSKSCRCGLIAKQLSCRAPQREVGVEMPVHHRLGRVLQKIGL